MNSRKIQTALTQIMIYHPFFASVLLNSGIAPDETVPTACTDGFNIRYNPVWMNALTVQEICAVLCHEVLHIIMLHLIRRETRDMSKWLIATDLAINPIVKRMGSCRLPDNCLYDPSLKDMSAEKIYNTLLPNADAGQLRIGEFTAIPGTTTADVQASLQKIKLKVAQAYSTAKLAGNIPGNLERIITELLYPKIPWKEALAKFVTITVTNDYCWQLPNRRYLHTGIYLPQLNQPTIADFVIVIDTSGSITADDLNEFAGEVNGIIQSYPESNIHLYYVDTEIAGYEEIRAADLKLKPKGGGGTSYVPAFTDLREKGINPCCLIYFTDGYCCSYDSCEPDFPVLWLLTRNGTSAENFTPPYGDIVKIA